MSDAPTRMSESEVAKALRGVPEWAELHGAIQRTFSFANFVESMKFVDRVAALAEAQQHHPDILIRYNKVTLTVNTHDAGGITSKDFALAHAVDAIVPAPAAKSKKKP